MKLLGFVCLFFVGVVALIAQPNSFTRNTNSWLDNYINEQLAPFYHGVASGDPLNNAVIIWTRVTQPDSLNELSINVDWELATDINFTNVVQLGSITTDAEKDFTVKIDVQNLNADTYYYYRFKAFNTYSIIGRTKTTPIVNIDKLRIATISCSNYQEGFFSAYKALADRSDLDAILHLGDYIYENEFDNKTREHQPQFETYDLLHYRQRYSQYRLDKDLMRCHQVHPMVIIWDDHDIVVDALRDTSLRHNPAYGLYSERKFEAIKAAREWLPIRDIDNNFFKNWRKLNFGNLAEVMMIDARLYDRDNWPADINDTLYGSANAKFLGPEQLNWLNDEIKNSNAQWKIIGNGLMIAQLNAIGPNPVVMENWDGYPYERNLFYDNLIDNNIDNVVFVTGDFHCSFSCNLTKNPKDTLAFDAATGDGSLAVEFIVPSISGSNYDEDGADSLFAVAAADLIKGINQHIKFAELTGHGYVLLDIDSNRTQAEFWHMRNIKIANDYRERLVSIWQTENGANKLKEGTTVSNPKTGFGVVPDEPPFNYSGINKNAKPVILTITPNPFKTSLFCNYVLNEKTNISITLTDMNNKVVENILADIQEKGNYFISVNTQKIVTGVYFINFQYNDKVVSKKIVKQ